MGKVSCRTICVPTPIYPLYVYLFLQANLQLKPYQKEGVKWLINTWKRGLYDGGLLCDDMGLGKTCQVIHLLKYIHNIDKSAEPSLVVVPLSVFDNWQKEFKMYVNKVLITFMKSLTSILGGLPIL